MMNNIGVYDDDLLNPTVQQHHPAATKGRDEEQDSSFSHKHAGFPKFSPICH